MKKTLFIGSLIILMSAGFFIFNFNAKADTSSDNANFKFLDLEITSLQLTKASGQYSAGDKIEGKIILKNKSDSYVSGVYLETLIHHQTLDSKTAATFFLDGSTIYDRLRPGQSISFAPQEEKEISFSHQISKYFPAGKDYYFQIVIYSSHEQSLIQKYQKISINNDSSQEKFIFFDGTQSKVFGKDRLYGPQAGAIFNFNVEYKPVEEENMPKSVLLPPAANSSTATQIQLPTTLKNQVKAKIQFFNRAGQIDNPIVKLTSYRYGSPLKEIASRSNKIGLNLFSKDSSGALYFILPLFEQPGTYETFIQFFDGEEKISNPFGVRYITGGDSGLIFEYFVEKKDDNKFVLNALLVGPADIASRLTLGKDLTTQKIDFPTQLSFAAKEDSTNRICYSKMIDANLSDGGVIQEPFVLENCSEPYTFQLTLQKDGKELDNQAINIIAPFVAGPAAKNTMIYALIAILIVIIGLVIFFWQRYKKGKLPPIATGVSILLILIGSFFLVANAKAFSGPTLISPANNSQVNTDPIVFSWARPSGFTPGFIKMETRSYYGFFDYNVEIDGWYNLVIDGTVVQSGLETESASVPSGSYPSPNHSWYIEAVTGQKPGACLWQDQASGDCWMWAWAYTPEVTASSATWNFTKLASYNGAAGFMPYCCMIGPYNSGLGQSVTTPGLAYDWIYSKFNDASDLSPNLNVYQKKLKGWWWLDTNLSVPNYTWDSSDGYFNVPATETAFRIDNTIDPSFNCLNFEGIGQGSFAWFIVDKNNNLVKSYQTPGKWYLTYTEPWFGSPTYSSNLPLSGLAQNKKYSLIIQDYRLFTGSMGGPVFVSFNYVVTDFCYGNCAPPAAPSNASASISSCSKINLSWQDNSNNETIFKIERKTDSTGWTQITTVGPNITSYPDSGLAENTKYYYHIIAYNEYGDSGYSNEAINTTYICPWVDLKVNGSDNPTINYNDNVPINWDTNGITTCDASGDWSGSKAIPNGSEQTGNLTSDKTYILNCNGPGGSKSDTVNVNVNPPGAPNPTLTGRSLPTSPFVDGPISITSGNSVTLKWEPTNNPTSCVASGNAQWSALTSDVLKVAGQTTINNVTAGTIFNLSCTIAGVSGTDFFEVKILDANLTHAPASGTAGVTSFSFTATVTAGITSGTFKYEFYCNDTDPNPVIPAVTNPASSFTASNICIYPTPGSKTAKVIVSHSDGWVTAKTNITVNACVPNSITPCGNGSCTGTKTCNSSGTGYGNCSTSGNTCASATDCKNVSVCDTSGSCSVQTNKANGTACTSDSNSCTDDTCSAGTCIHPAISGTHKECSGPTCVSVANTSLMCTDGCASNVTCSAGNTIDITINGKGTVSSVPSGTPASDCTASCTKAYTSGQTVTLTPINTSAGYKFKEWQGDCDSKPGNQCKVAMDGNPKAVTAIFSFTPWWKEIIPW